VRSWSQDGTTVTEGQNILVLAPSDAQVWEALRGLYLVGQTEDLETIQNFTGRSAHLGERKRQQARFTIEAIRKRSSVFRSSSVDVQSSQRNLGETYVFAQMLSGLDFGSSFGKTSLSRLDDYTLGPDSQIQTGSPQRRGHQVFVDQPDFSGYGPDYWVYVPKQYDPAKPACTWFFRTEQGTSRPTVTGVSPSCSTI
jgi:hypothetical protein